jgi:integrase
MATITPYETARGRRYRVRYRKPDGSQTDKRGFTTKRDANEFLNSTEVSKGDGSYIDPTRGRATVGELGEAWLKRQTHWKESHRYAVKASWRNYVEPRWGSSAVATITRTEISTWVAELSDAGKSRTVISRALGILSGALADAVDDRIIRSNPAVGVKNLPAKTTSEKVFLTHEEVWAFANHCGPHRTFVLLLAYTGLRWGEATGLKAKHINLARRRLSVEENAVAVGGKIVTGTPKSHEQRTVPLPKFLVPLLYDIIAELDPDDLLFTRADGGHLRRPKTGRSWWAKALRESNIEKAPTPHSMRHTAASLAIQAGVNIKALQRMLGHESAALTLDRYGHLYQDDLEKVTEGLDAAVGALVGT